MAICDVLIIGSGIAGLSLALKLNKQFPDRKIYVVTKQDEKESNTCYAQGGISVVCDTHNDSFEKHIEDTLKAGDGLCNRDVVEKVIRHAQLALSDLTENGVEFDRDVNGDFVLGKEGGHSRSRIVHYKDLTGSQIVVSLLAKVKAAPGIVLLPNHVAIDLITECQLLSQRMGMNGCYGAFILNRKTMTVEKMLSRVTVLATGGIGQVYKTTTNPGIATGDGIAIGHRAGASIQNMEFIQFHPTAFYSNTDHSPNFLISEAIRGYGAFLLNQNGNRFMFKYDPQGELACRDVVARAIQNEINTSDDRCVFVDCRHLPAKQLINNFPKIYAYCLKNGVNITTDLIPVLPAAHYLCGGIAVDMSSRTSINYLYALGECSHTGLHGANRLASNSLLEAVACSEFCFQDIRKSIGSIAINSAALEIKCQSSADDQQSADLAIVKEKVQNLMTKYAGITRTTSGLKYALDYLAFAHETFNKSYADSISIDALELRNILVTAKLIVSHSLKRSINKGAFYNPDLDISTGSNANKQAIYS